MMCARRVDEIRSTRRLPVRGAVRNLAAGHPLGGRGASRERAIGQAGATAARLHARVAAVLRHCRGGGLCAARHPRCGGPWVRPCISPSSPVPSARCLGFSVALISGARHPASRSSLLVIRQTRGFIGIACFQERSLRCECSFETHHSCVWLMGSMSPDVSVFCHEGAPLLPPGQVAPAPAVPMQPQDGRVEALAAHPLLPRAQVAGACTILRAAQGW